jgi:hypothetical protein
MLGAFAKLRKATISFVMSVCPHETTRLPLDGFCWNLILRLFLKHVEKIQVPFKSDKNNGYFTRRRFQLLTISRQILHRMRNVLDKSCRENQNTHFMFNNFFFRKSHSLCENVEKCGGNRGTTVWRTRVACWISMATCTYALAHATRPAARTLAQACTHRPIINTYCFYTATLVSWTRLNVTLCVHCMSCYITHYTCIFQTFFVEEPIK